jgi:hypothetical protein
MKITRANVFFVTLALLFLCPTQNILSATPPGDLTMNKDAGRGGLLFVMVRLDDGEKLPFVLDTGNPTTCLDQSLEPKLGNRVRSEPLWAFGVRSQINVYSAPHLYLGKTLLLKNGSLIVTHDCRQMSADVGRPILGVLGMDILRNYCIQLDFTANKIRFLDDKHADKSDWGTSFPISYIQDGCPSIGDNLVGAAGISSLIDTGCDYDGWLIPQLFQQWTDSTSPHLNGQTHAPNGILAGQTYPDLNLRGVDPKLLSSGDTHIQFNGLGLHFLSRHLVTLDFPNNTLYLKRTSVDALDHKGISPDAKSNIESSAKILKTLAQNGQLPGWSKTDELATSKVTFVFDSGAVTFNVQKNADLSIYHYKFSQSYEGGSWHLTRAWHTDTIGHIIQEYPIP